MGMTIGQGAHMGLGLGGGHGAHLGAGAGLLACPAGSGLMPGLHLQGGLAAGSGGVAKSVTAALGQNTAASPVAAAVAGKTAAAGSAMASAKGISLGLGIGLGAWGPLLLAGLSAAGAYALWKTYKPSPPKSEEEIELSEALSSK
jgi:hypothetical protein